MTTADAAMPVNETYSPPERVRDGALVTSREGYEALWRRSLDEPDAFWTEMANEHLDLIEPWHTLKEENLAEGEIAWFLGAKLNVSVNCLDRHLAERAVTRPPSSGKATSLATTSR